VPNFEEYLDQVDQMDPVDSLWAMLKTGLPLLTIYNALQPAEPLHVDATGPDPKKTAKVATFRFVQACLKELNMPSVDCFVISDLTGNDTTGFVKVGRLSILSSFAPSRFV
jgi:cell division control protein 24